MNLVRMKIFVGLVALVTTAAAMENSFHLSSPFRYRCMDEKCTREQIVRPVEEQQFPYPNQNGLYTTLAECNLVCGKYGSLWPYPKDMVEPLADETIQFMAHNVLFSDIDKSVSNPKVREMLLKLKNIFLSNVRFLGPHYPQKSKGPFVEHQEDRNLNNDIQGFNRKQFGQGIVEHNVTISITTHGQKAHIDLDTDESYDMSVNTEGGSTAVTITSPQYYGARNALATLLQLINYNELSRSWQIVKKVTISDKPAFKYRGLLLDTGRNFYPKYQIFSLLDTMAMNKLNTFHWHISDTASFPMYFQREPLMAYYGTYSPSQVYYPEDVSEIVEYANLRGIRVVPELDMPGHAGAGWNFGEQPGKDNIVTCNEYVADWFKYCKEPPCGQLNPTNNETYNVIGNVFTDILEAFNPEFIHTGGDDVSFRCWNATSDITNFLTANGYEVNSQGFFQLWYDFETEVYKRLQEAELYTGITSGKPMIYSSTLVKGFLAPEKYIVQIIDKTNAPIIKEYIEKGFQVVFSNINVWSFGKPTATWNDTQERFIPDKDVPLPSWEQVYANNPLEILSDVGVGVQSARDILDQVLGGEAMIWSSKTDAESVQPLAWPRGAALAERLWSDPHKDHMTADQLANRMAIHRARMVRLGTQAEAFEPEFCLQNQGSCPE